MFGISSNRKNKATPSTIRDEQLKSNFIIQAIEDGVILIDTQRVIRVFNPGAVKVSGWTEKEAVGLDYHSVMKMVDNKGQPFDNQQDPFERVFKEGKPVHVNNATLVTREKNNISISLNVSPLFDDKQQINAAVGVFDDVSQERKEEQQRAEFISTASHEMRTPVAAIEGYLALALNDKVSTIDSRAKGYLEKAHSSTQGLGKLFQDLLTSAKADDGRLTSHPTVVELSSFLQNLTNDLSFSALKKGLLVNFSLGSSKVIDATNTQAKVLPPLYYVYADPDRIKEVIVNLFDNAVKYTEKGKILIGLTGDNDIAQFYVKDSGPGIPAEDIPHLFQKFYRVDNSATRTVGGTGLGLFISRKIIELYKGKIWVESQPGKGCTFFVNLPRLTSQQAEQLKAAAESSPLSSL